jgi:hypothetical protein
MIESGLAFVITSRHTNFQTLVWVLLYSHANFQTLVWVLLYTSLRNQQTHLELLGILIYIFMSKNKHKLGNNISNRDKIRVNSPEVHFGIS